MKDKCNCGHSIEEHIPYGDWEHLKDLGFPNKCGENYSCDHCEEDATWKV